MLSIDLSDKVAFVAGIGDDQGYGWAIAKSLHAAGCKVIAGTWPPIYKIFTSSYQNGKFDQSRRHPNGEMLEFLEIVPLDASFDDQNDVPEEIKNNKRYTEYTNYTISECAEMLLKKYGNLDILIHSLANAPEAKKSLLETSRQGYLAAMSASAYSFVSLVKHFGPNMKQGGAALSLSYIAAEKVIPGYGGGLNAAKAALESDTRVLAWEARKWNIRVNTISAGPLGSRAAKAIGFIEKMIDYNEQNSPLSKPLTADEVGMAAAFLCSPLASAITGTVIYVDNGMHAMGVAINSPSLS
ncbi:MAG: enoyl-[acyl-carrier-protein] reductase [Chlamydiales bacterium]